MGEDGWGVAAYLAELGLYEANEVRPQKSLSL
jgi:hypothetical protein